MKHALLVFLICFIPVAFGQSVAESNIQANVPDAKDFRALFVRDASEYLSTKVGRRVSVEYELLREGPTQTGVGYPKFYAWVRAIGEDKQPVLEGAMRLSAIEKKRFQITSFLAKKEIVVAPARIEEIFPRPLLPKIREKADIK